MYDLERTSKIISDIEKYLRELQSYHIQTKQDLVASKDRHASSMLIFSILNRMIDLGSEILSKEKVGAPQRYEDIMLLLANANVINTETATQLNSLIKKRNVFAHFYGDVTPKDILEILHQQELIERFIATVKKRVLRK